MCSGQFEHTIYLQSRIMFVCNRKPSKRRRINVGQTSSNDEGTLDEYDGKGNTVAVKYVGS